MKTKKLIEHLNKLDPDGNAEVCISNCDIEQIEMLPAYWDGRITLITETENDVELGIPTASKKTASGTKINLYAHQWQEKFMDAITDNCEEYKMTAGDGAAGYGEFNWLTAEVNCTKYKLVIEAMDVLKTAKEHGFYSAERYEEKMALCESLKKKYVDYACDRLLEYVNKSGHVGSLFYGRKMRHTAKALIEKCRKALFPLEVFRHGEKNIVNKNANWMGYEFMIGDRGEFSVKQYKSKEYVPCDINTFDFGKVTEEWIKAIRKSSEY